MIRYSEASVDKSEGPKPTASAADNSGTTHGSGVLSTAQKAISLLFGPVDTRSFAVRYWDESVDRPHQDPLFTLVLRKPGALRRMLTPPSELAIAEAFLRDDFDIEGDFPSAVGLADQVAERLSSPGPVFELFTQLLRVSAADEPVSGSNGHESSGALHSKERDAAAVRYHYDIGNDFYRIWLDSQMVYSCAYFDEPDADLEDAQAAKLDYICRKLRLSPGDRLLDIGCGWGALLRFAVKHYGVQALGITLSESQAALARERIVADELDDRCQVEIRDYRDLEPSQMFDKIASVGMFEHVGKSKMTQYFAEVFRHLVPGGLFLNHGIVLTSLRRSLPLANPITRLVWREGSFVQRYVFPDGELLTPGYVIYCAENSGFETRDVESLREHYEMTLRHWLRRLEQHRKGVEDLVGPSRYRVWRLYLASSAYSFAVGRIGVVQMLLSKADKNGKSLLPLTRKHLYCEK